MIHAIKPRSDLTPKIRDVAENKGYRAAMRGKSKESCPYRHFKFACMEMQCYRFWMSGFYRGLLNRKNIIIKETKHEKISSK